MGLGPVLGVGFQETVLFCGGGVGGSVAGVGCGWVVVVIAPFRLYLAGRGLVFGG